MFAFIIIDDYMISVDIKSMTEDQVVVSCEIFFKLGAVGSTLVEALQRLEELYYKLRDIYLNKVLKEFDLKLSHHTN